MATQKSLINSLADALAWTGGAVEAYALELSRMGWWEKTKRGRGARPVTSMDAAKLLLALLSDGPKSLAGGGNDAISKYDGAGFFLRYANMVHFPADRGSPLIMALAEDLCIDPRAGFLDYIEGSLRLIQRGEAERVFWTSDMHIFGPWEFSGPNPTFAVRGPYPVASMRFSPSTAFRDKLIARGVEPEIAASGQEIYFLHQMFGWHADAMESGAPTAAYDKILNGIREHSERGISFEKSFGGRELAACAQALAEGVA